MSGLHQKLDSVKDSIASLFKKRGGRRSSNDSGGSGSGGKKNGRISTPQNVKRVMHITFDSGNQSFDGIPAQWQQYFEAKPAASQGNAGPSDGSARSSGTAEAQPPPEEAAATEEAAEEATPAAAEAAESGAAAAAAAPKELLSLVYDRDAGQFVNLPPHWEERLKRNNLLEPEFHTNPSLLTLVFTLMDEELRSMRAEGNRVESCLYSSDSAQSRQSVTSTDGPPPFVFRIEADKSNSSSELDLSDERPGLRSERGSAATTSADGTSLAPPPPDRHHQRGSFVTVMAVEVPPEQRDTPL